METRIFGAICSLHRALVRQNDINLSEYGISAVQFHALIYIHRNSLKGNSVCQRDIERETGLRPSSVSSMLSTLEGAGFISRTPSKDDARIKYIVLTHKGEQLCLKNKVLMDKCDEEINSALTPEELVTLHALISKILDSIK